jgi:aspartate aminotransferase-like enzyme
MPGLLPNIDPDGLLEYSVVYTDRSLNHMSNSFQSVMNDVSESLKKVYSAEAVILVPGGGTYAMEAVARQFATNKSCLVLRNGWFSYRWSQILEMGDIPSEQVVLKASKISDGSQAPFAPVDVNEVVIQIKNQKPAMVFAPHVETSAGIILPDEYIQTVAE